MVSNRLIWIDVLRGCAILLVVLGHFLQHTEYQNLWNIIYSFHMALFFCISGYVSYRTKNTSLFSDFVIHRAKQLLLPLSFWTMILYAERYNTMNHYNLIEYILYPDKGYWFLWVLFVITIISTAIIYLSHLKKNDWTTLLMIITSLMLILIMVVFEFRLFGFQFIAFYFSFYILGYILRSYNWRIGIFQTIIVGIFWFVLALYWRMHEVPYPVRFLESFLPDSLIIYLYRFVSAFFGCMFFMNLVQLMKFKPDILIVQLLSYLGKITLAIYVMHVALRPVYNPISEILSVPLPYINVCTNFILSILFCVIAENTISRIPFIRTLLLGK